MKKALLLNTDCSQIVNGTIPGNLSLGKSSTPVISADCTKVMIREALGTVHKY